MSTTEKIVKITTTGKYIGNQDRETIIPPYASQASFETAMGRIMGENDRFWDSTEKTIKEHDGIQTKQVSSSAKIKFTDIGGFAVKLTNKTGANSVKGELVTNHPTINDAVSLSPGDSYDMIGCFLDSGIADGSEAWIVIGGIAEIMIKDGTAAVADAWVKISDTAGRADASATAPPGGGFTNADQHFREIGHGIQAAGSGTNVIVRILMHFN